MSPPKKRRTAAKPYSLRSNPHLYEINTWAWLEKLSARGGRTIRLQDIPDSEWDALAGSGFNVVWLMGVWRRSAEARRVALANSEKGRHDYDLALPGWKPEDIIGSPYSVAAYSPDPRIGTFDSVDLIREKLHRRGMGLFLDFVGNHTALDHPWMREHPEFYVQGSEEDFKKEPGNFYRVDGRKGANFTALGRDPYFPPWPDVAQLNYFSPELRAAQIAELGSIAQHCDGVRCDMAMLQLSDVFERVWSHLLGGAKAPAKEFWAEARAAVPSLILLAEAYWGTEQRLLDLGFSFVYDKSLYDAVRDSNVGAVHGALEQSADYQGHLARFLENHDEGRCATVFHPERLNAVGTIMGSLPGMRFYHQCELEGVRAHLPITLRMAADEARDPVSAQFFEKILRITSEDVFHEGTWSLLQVTPDNDDTSGNLIVYEWRWKKSWKLIAANLAGYPSQGRVHFGDRPLPKKQYAFYDQLHDVRYVRDTSELRSIGLFVRRDGFDAHLFDITPA